MPSCTTLFKCTSWLALALLVAACAPLDTSRESIDEFRLPPITTQPTGVYHPGKFVWHDLLTPDSAAAQKFYGELFGWRFVPAGQYIEIFNGDTKIGGILRLHPEKNDTISAQWLPAMSVEDITLAKQYVQNHGGKILNGPLSLGERGKGLLISDPAGAHLLLLHAANGDPRDRTPRMNDWLWNEVWALELATLIDFYQNLGQYPKVIQENDYAILVNEGHWRAGLRKIEQAAYAGRWVPVIRVADPAALLDKVRQLGGTVWLEPGEGNASNDTALISDNTGAMLILQRWQFNQEGAS